MRRVAGDAWDLERHLPSEHVLVDLSTFIAEVESSFAARSGIIDCMLLSRRSIANGSRSRGGDWN
jgi:hypothetical protein